MKKQIIINGVLFRGIYFNVYNLFNSYETIGKENFSAKQSKKYQYNHFKTLLKKANIKFSEISEGKYIIRG